jgi:hypothetical protein
MAVLNYYRTGWIGKMSTDIYLECQDHDPVITSEMEVGQHGYDLPNIREMVEHRASFSEDDEVDYSPWADSWEPRRGYFYINTAKFLLQHPRCTIGIRDEYGIEYPLVAEDSP